MATRREIEREIRNNPDLVLLLQDKIDAAKKGGNVEFLDWRKKENILSYCKASYALFKPRYGIWIARFLQEATCLYDNLNGLSYIQTLLGNPLAQSEGIHFRQLESPNLPIPANLRETQSLESRKYQSAYKNGLKQWALNSLNEGNHETTMKILRSAIEAGVYFTPEEWLQIETIVQKRFKRQYVGADDLKYIENKSRVRVFTNIKRAKRLLEKQIPSLGEHLDLCIKQRNNRWHYHPWQDQGFSPSEKWQLAP